MNRALYRTFSGFTIPELLVSITILGILSTIGVVSFLTYNTQARDTVRMSDLNNIKKVLSLQKLDAGHYPVSTNAVDITYSGAVVWSQGEFGNQTIAETGKIFGDLTDPKYENKYTYSVTQNRKEYQIGAYFEIGSNNDELFSFDTDLFSPAVAYANTAFTPLDLNPKIWLDAMDIDGDDNLGNNPSDGANISAWVNKSSLGSANNPTITSHGALRYSQDGFENSDTNNDLPGVFIANNRGLTLENSDITNGYIFYVVQKEDPFGSTDNKGFGLYGVNNSNYYIGYNTNNRRDALRLGGSPSFAGSSWGRTSPFIYALGINGGNYEFFDTGNRIRNGLTNGASGITWGFNRAGSSSSQSDLVVSEILIFDYNLTVTERQMIEGYLAHKWGQVSYVAQNHPYKSAPPEALTPPTPDFIPDAFVIDDVTGADPSVSYISNPFTISGVNVSVPIEITNGEYSVNGNSYTSASGSISQGDTIRVRITSSDQSLTSVSTTVTIGGVSEDYVVTTKSIDNTPDVFSFSPVSDAQLSTTYASTTTQITGTNVPLIISVSGTGAEYKITDGLPADVTGAGTAGGAYRNSSNRSSYAFDDNLSSGWGSPNNFPAILSYDLGSGNNERINAYSLYRSSSQSGFNNDRYSPSDWTFQASNNGTTWVTLDTQTGQVINRNATARTFEFSNSQFFRYYRFYITDAVNSNRVNLSEVSLLNLGDGVFRSTPTTIHENDYVVLKIPASSEYATSTQAVLQVGSSTGSFVVTTLPPPPDYDPDVFTFASQDDAAPNTQYISDPVNITGITANTSISISGGEYEINGSGIWSNSSYSNLVAPNDSIAVRATSHPVGGQIRNVILNIGPQSATYTITTLLDNIPDTISFPEKTLVEVNTTISSDIITISGINTQIPITNVSGGEYSINGGNWSSANAQLENNDEIVLRVNASSNFNTVSSMDITIAGQVYTFDVTTELADITPDTFTFLDIEDADLSVSYISEAIVISDINAPTAISIDNAEYRIGNGAFTSDPGFVENGQEVSVRLMSANIPNQTTLSQVTIGGVSDYFEIETKDVVIETIEYEKPESNTYVSGDYNGLIAYAHTGAIHYVLTTPSIIAYDTTNTDFEHIISENKLVYNGFENIPETYKDSNLTMSGGFDFPIVSPLVFAGTKEDLGSYSGLKEVDIGIRDVYNNFPGYAYIAKYLDTFSLNYLENILGDSIGINPIKPYYCSDILRTKLVYNVARTATIVADTPENPGMQAGINNGKISTEAGFDPEYISQDGNAGVDFSWQSAQKIGYIRIYNTVSGRSQDLSDAVITFYNAFGGIIDTYSIGFDTTGDYIVDLDFESIGKIHHAHKVRIQTTGGKKLSLREVEIYLGGELESGTYRVDKDGAGGLSPYNVYCDMETEGGGWTRIGENYISNGKFLRGNHTAEYTYLDPLENIIVDGTTKLPPVYAADAYVLRHSGAANKFYELSFDNIPGKYYAQEIRLGAWVDGTNSSIFSYELDYETEPNISDIAEFEITQTDGTWNYVQTRIPLSDVVDNFKWKIGDQITGPIYVTDLDMEVYYK